MIEQTLRVKNWNGISSTNIYKLSRDYNSEFTLVVDGREVNCKNLAEVIHLWAGCGQEVKCLISGEDEELLFENLKALV